VATVLGVIDNGLLSKRRTNLNRASRALGIVILEALSGEKGKLVVEREADTVKGSCQFLYDVERSFGAACSVSMSCFVAVARV
jgi:hypothetical protein